jgi:hypothetical protein
MKHVSNKTMKLSMRIGLAVAAALLAMQVSTGRASASVQDVTITSITRIDLTHIQVSGTATFSAGDLLARVIARLAQIQRGVGWNSSALAFLNTVPGDASADPRGTYTYEWTVSIYNAYGWKPGPAILTVTAESYDPILNQESAQTKSAKVTLPR